MPVFGSRDEVVGVIQLVNKKGGNDFTTSDESVLSSMAAHISVALKMASVTKDDQDPTNKTMIMEALRTSNEQHRHLQRRVTKSRRSSMTKREAQP